MQNNIDYWKRRQIREAFNVFSQAEIAADEIAKLYRKASAYMDAKMQGVYDKFKRKYGLTDEQAKQLLAAASDRGSIDAALQALQNGPQTESVTELRKVVESAAYAARIQQIRELEISAGQVMNAIYKQELAKNTALYEKLITDSYRKSIFAIQQRAGVAFSFSDVNPKLMERLLHSKWSGKNYSVRLWGNTQEVAENVKEQIILGALTGKTEREMAEALNETFAKGARVSRRLIRTESNYIFTQADMAARKECDIRRYMYLATLDMKTCAETCGKLDGRIFLVKDQKPGYNCPPMHPWCVLPDTKIIAPDAEAMTQSYYSGDVIEMLTANGTRLTVTPNHIVLTSRGWVRAKNLAKGDKVIYYRGWNKAGAESDPTNDNSIPTIEQLFASAVEASGGTSCRVPASAVDFKGDVVPQSEINIVNIDSKLRDKLDPAARKLVSDVLLVEAGEASKIALNGKCFVKQFLAGLGLAADGIMSGLNVAHVLRMGTLTHHELVGLRISTDYDTRLFETENNDVSGNSKGICDFVDGFPSVVMLDDIVDVKIRKFSGHVYDASSLSTLYIANGIITSNCRCTTLSIISDEWIKTQTRRARDPETGRTYKVPLSMTYGEWKKKYLGSDASKPKSGNKGNGNDIENYLRNNLPSKKSGFKDTRNVGEYISKQDLARIKEKAQSYGIRMGADEHSNGNFELYRGDPEVLENVVDELGKQIGRAKANHLFRKDDDVILNYDNVLGYEGDDSKIDVGAFAMTKGKTITLNKFMYDDSDYLKSEYESAVKSHLFPQGTTYKNVVIHEFGHIIDRKHPEYKMRLLAILRKSAKNGNIKPQIMIRDKISGYASNLSEMDSDYPELLAEIYNAHNGMQPEYVNTLLRKAGIGI